MADTWIKDVRKELASLLAADVQLTNVLQVHVYNSRQLPGMFDNELCVFSSGNSPAAEESLGGGGSPTAQFSIFWLCKFKTENLSVVEDTFDDIENALYRVLYKENKRHALWKKLSFPNLSRRLPAPGGTQNSLFAQTVVRVKPYD